jgi:hypothetical protein
MASPSAFPPRRPGDPASSRPAVGGFPRRRPSAESDESQPTEMVRMEAAAIEAGRWLRRTGRVSLPVRTLRRNEDSHAQRD